LKPRFLDLINTNANTIRPRPATDPTTIPAISPPLKESSFVSDISEADERGGGVRCILVCRLLAHHKNNIDYCLVKNKKKKNRARKNIDVH
jgi:hypothetical protein